MNSISPVASVSSKKSFKSVTLARSTRGASMVEYALLLVAILLVAGSAYKTLGHKLNKSVKETHAVLL